MGGPADFALDEYLKDPDAIYRESFRQIRAETALERFNRQQQTIVMRMVHACANPEIAKDVVFKGDVIDATKTALQANRPIVVDSQMTEMAIVQKLLPDRARVLCPLRDTDAAMAQKQATTRSAAAIQNMASDLNGAIVLIGNAPTALFALLKLMAKSKVRPAALFAFPVGFVGAKESKDALISLNPDVPFVTLTGRLGGSAIAGGAFNAALSETSSK